MLCDWKSLMPPTHPHTCAQAWLLPALPLPHQQVVLHCIRPQAVEAVAVDAGPACGGHTSIISLRPYTFIISQKGPGKSLARTGAAHTLIDVYNHPRQRLCACRARKEHSKPSRASPEFKLPGPAQPCMHPPTVGAHLRSHWELLRMSVARS